MTSTMKRKRQTVSDGHWQLRDYAVCAIVVVLLFWLLQVGGKNLSYHWNWQAAIGYVVATDDSGAWQTGLLLSGLAGSIRLLILGGILSLVIGALAAAVLLSPLRGLGVLYVESLRNMPPIVFMFIFFYFADVLSAAGGLGAWLVLHDGAWLRFVLGNPQLAENLIGGIVCLALFEGAFFAGIIRAGVLSVQRGQWDAARALGLRRWQTLRRVVLPQALQNTAAPLVGQLILLIKDSAILSVISVQELTFSAQEAAVSSRQIFEVWLLAAAFYFMLNWPLMRWSDALEKSGGRTAQTKLPT